MPVKRMPQNEYQSGSHRCLIGAKLGQRGKGEPAGDVSHH